MVIKNCKICGKEFDARRNAKYCTKECSDIARKEKKKEYNKIYQQSDKYKATRKKYLQSDKGKDAVRRAQQKYYQSDKCKAAKKRYNESEKGKAARKKYNESDKGKATNKKYMQNKIAKFNKQYDGDLDLILKDCHYSWMEREAKMQVWFNESYMSGMIAKIKSTPVCEVTMGKDDLVIHHLYSFNTHPELGNDPANMVRISQTVHDEFHNIYGRGNNTPEQWMEFIENKGGD